MQNRLTNIENNLAVTSGEMKEEGQDGIWDSETQTTTYKIDEQQGYTE